MMDDELLNGLNDDEFSPLSLLAGLLTHPYVRLLRYADNGPPESAPRAPHRLLGEVVPGWVVVGPLGSEPCYRTVTVASTATLQQGALRGNAVTIAGNDHSAPAYQGLDDDEARLRRQADATAAQAAGVAGVDIFVSVRPYLRVVRWDIARTTLVASPEDALPLVSLYLRRQGEYITFRDLAGRFTDCLDRTMFYWVGACELLPSCRRWFAASAQDSPRDPRRDPGSVHLAQTLLQRVQRGLQARDDALKALNQPQTPNIAETALASLDVVLLMLMGAVDASARVAHRCVGLSGDEYEAGWQRGRWVGEVREVAPDLAAVVEPRTANWHVLEILRLLRNSIHGAALDYLGVHQSPVRSGDTLVGLPEGNAEKVVTAMDQVGGREAWGIRSLLPDRVHAEPALLLDRLFAGVLVLLDDVMRLMPVPGGVTPVGERVDEVVEQAPLDYRTRTSVRWQLGLRPTLLR